MITRIYKINDKKIVQIDLSNWLKKNVSRNYFFKELQRSCGPRILHDAFPLDLFVWWKYMIFRKDLESLLIFVLFFLLRENKIRKKTFSVTPYLEKTVCEKNQTWVQGSGYLLGRYGKNRNTHLSSYTYNLY